MTNYFDISDCQATALAPIHGGGEYGKSLLLWICDTFPDVDMDIIYRDKKDPFLTTLKKFPHIRLHLCENIAEYRGFLETSDLPGNNFIFPMPYRLYQENLAPKRATATVVVHGLRFIEVDVRRQELSLASSAAAIAKAALKYSIPKNKFFSMQFEKYAGLFNSLKADDRLAVVSDFTQRLISIFYQETATKHSVHKVPPLTPFSQDRAVVTAPASERRDILMLAANRPEKNFLCVLEALNMLAPGAFAGRIKTLGLSPALSAKLSRKYPYAWRFIEPLDYVKADELKKLYGSVRFLLFPSISEGYGMPPVEAMRSGTPTLASYASSIPEVCGDAVEYFCPYSPCDLAGKLIALYNDDVRREQLASMAAARYDYLKDMSVGLNREFWSAVLKTGI